MVNSQKRHFDRLAEEVAVDTTGGIWELPDEIIDEVAGGLDFYQGSNFAQNYSCFAQNIGSFSQGTPPIFG